MSTAKSDFEGHYVFETLKVLKEAGVLFVKISAPPMNLEGPELVRDLVSLIQQAEADESVQVHKTTMRISPNAMAGSIERYQRPNLVTSSKRSPTESQPFPRWATLSLRSA